MFNQLHTIENQWILLPDGQRLASRIWMPVGHGPFPAILEYLPYRKRDGTAPHDETTHRVIAEAGYVCIRKDITGTGDSEGQFGDEQIHYAVHPDDPASAKFRSKWNFTFERDDWEVGIDTENEMTCDQENFYLYCKLCASEGGAKSEVLKKEWQETVPRGLL